MESVDAPTGVVVRPAHIEDLPHLTRIYNHYVLNTPITFDLEPFTVEQRRKDWLSKFSATGPHQLFVAEERGVEQRAHTSARRRGVAVDRRLHRRIVRAPVAEGSRARIAQQVAILFGNEQLVWPALRELGQPAFPLFDREHCEVERDGRI